MVRILKIILGYLSLPIRIFYLNPRLRYKLLFSDTIYLHPDEVILKNSFEFSHQANTKGHYLEFGVWKGRSFSRAFNIWRHLSKANLGDMKFYAFDSFQGLPPITSAEDKATGEFKEGQYSCGEQEFKEVLACNGVDLSRVITVKGWFSDTLKNDTKRKLGLQKASIVFIDSDLYEAAVSVLDFITDIVVDGTIIIFDDWFCFKGSPVHGEQKAFHDWLSRNPQITASEYQKFNWKGNSFIIHKK